MIIRCALGQQSGPDYSVSTHRGTEDLPSTSPVYAAPSDRGIEGHGTFHVGDVAMAEIW